jgi:Holliday junction resolvasome RuvABC endonuclease subunit
MTNDLITLSLDLGSTLGWVLGNNGIVQSSGEVALFDKKGTHPGKRLLRFQEWLYEHRHVHEILFEEVTMFFKGNAAAIMYGRMLGQLEVFSLMHNIPLRSLPVGTIKKDFTGNGSAKKELMCDVAINLGWKNGTRGTRNNDNECDAIALYWVVCLRRGIKPSFAAGEQVMLDIDGVKGA